jgi:hypothetical protein
VTYKRERVSEIEREGEKGREEERRRSSLMSG